MLLMGLNYFEQGCENNRRIRVTMNTAIIGMCHDFWPLPRCSRGYRQIMYKISTASPTYSLALQLIVRMAKIEISSWFDFHLIFCLSVNFKKIFNWHFDPILKEQGVAYDCSVLLCCDFSNFLVSLHNFVDFYRDFLAAL